MRSNVEMKWVLLNLLIQIIHSGQLSKSDMVLSVLKSLYSLRLPSGLGPITMGLNQGLVNSLMMLVCSICSLLPQLNDGGPLGHDMGVGEQLPQWEDVMLDQVALAWLCREHVCILVQQFSQFLALLSRALFSQCMPWKT